MLNLLKSQWLEIIDYCVQELPNEACGLLAGKDFNIQKIFFISNQYKSPTRFLMEPLELLAAFNWMDDHNQDLLASFHSHPNGPNHPSVTDIKEFYYPGIESMIVFPDSDGWNLRSFKIENNSFYETDLQINFGKHPF